MNTMANNSAPQEHPNIFNINPTYFTKKGKAVINVVERNYKGKTFYDIFEFNPAVTDPSHPYKTVHLDTYATGATTIRSAAQTIVENYLRGESKPIFTSHENSALTMICNMHSVSAEEIPDIKRLNNDKKCLLGAAICHYVNKALAERN
jgi:hypothetical protein